MGRATALMAAALAVVSAAAAAHEGATGLIAERMAAMKALGKATKEISDMIAERRAYDAATVGQAALKAQAVARAVGRMFPPGTRDHHSHALGAIWDDPAAFARELEALRAATDALASADPADQSQVAPGLNALRETCSNCHEKFRLPD